jgi:hypothetical protein
MSKDTEIFIGPQGAIQNIDLNQFDNLPVNPTEVLALSTKIDLSIDPPVPPVILSILIDDFLYPVASLGNISVVIGKAKSRKTFLLTLFLAAWVAQGICKRIFKAGAPDGRDRVILLDTEQATHKVHQVGKKIQILSQNDSPLRLEVYGLRSKTVPERVEILKHIAYTVEGVFVIAIDGIRDLLYDINDPKESSELVGLLMKISEERNIHIVTVLHQNKGDNNARGHVGTEAINKAETVISVAKDEKNPDLSIVSPEFCREKEFPPFAIGIDDEGLPYVAGDWAGAATEPKTGKTPFDFPAKTHDMILRKVFENARSLKLAEFKESLKVTLQSFEIVAGDSKVKNFIAYYTDAMNWVLKTGKDKSPDSRYTYTGLANSLG